MSLVQIILLRIIPFLTPLLLGPIFIPVSGLLGQTMDAFIAYFFCIFLYILWETMQRSFLALKIPESLPETSFLAKKLNRKIILTISLISATLVACGLVYASIRFPAWYFYLLLSTLGIRSLSLACLTRANFLFYLLLAGFSDFMTGYISFALRGAFWQWQAILIVLSLASLLSALRLVSIFWLNSKSSPKKIETRIFQGLIIFAPTGLAILAYSHQLSVAYLASFAILPLAIPIFEKAARRELIQISSFTFTYRTMILFYVYVLTLAVATYMSKV